MTHYDNEQLRLHLFTPDPAITAHVEVCSDCSERLDFTREFEAALRDPLVWDTLQATQRTVSDDDRATAEAIEAEDQKAAELLAPAVVSIGAFEEHEVSVRRSYRSPGVVRVLVQEAKRVRDSSPRFALLLATAAITIASKLKPGVIRPSVLGAAWLERAIVEFLLGDYRESHAHLDMAQDTFRAEAADTSWDLANVWLTRANLCVETGRLDDALQLATDAAAVFAEHADESRQMLAFLIRGAVLYSRADYESAAAVYEAMIHASRAIQDSKTHARSLHNLAHCYLSLRELDRAADYFARAWAEWDALGADAERVRSRWLRRRSTWRVAILNRHVRDSRRHDDSSTLSGSLRMKLSSDSSSPKCSLYLVVPLRSRHSLPASRCSLQVSA